MFYYDISDILTEMYYFLTGEHIQLGGYFLYSA